SARSRAGTRSGRGRTRRAAEGVVARPRGRTRTGARARSRRPGSPGAGAALTGNATLARSRGTRTRGSRPGRLGRSDRGLLDRRLRSRNAGRRLLRSRARAGPGSGGRRGGGGRRLGGGSRRL